MKRKIINNKKMWKVHTELKTYIICVLTTNFEANHCKEPAELGM